MNFESGTYPAHADIQEVCNYVNALKYAREPLVAEHGLPLSVRLLNETHRLLMRGVRGAVRVEGDWEGWLDTASRAIEMLREAGILVETTGRRRDRSFVYRKYVDRLSEGTDLD